MYPNTQQIKTQWNNFAQGYNAVDSCMQTFFYSLVNMLSFKDATHILEIACGTGKLLPYAITNKSAETTYTATDLCDNMVELTKRNLRKYLDKMGVKQSLEEWSSMHNLVVKAANADEPIESAHKFDRIIANLVIMMVEDPVKTLKNLHSLAAENCLLGLTVWGNPQDANLMTLPSQALKEKGEPLANVRSNFHLFNKLEWLAEESGWQVVVVWQQNAPLSHIGIDESLSDFVAFISRGNEYIKGYMLQKIKGIFSNKKTLNFPVQMAILRKK